MRALLASFLSLLSACGGHLLNRRIDRVIFFIAVVLVWFIASIAIVYEIFLLPSSYTEYGVNLTNLAQGIWISFCGFVLIYCVSAIVTYIDARNINVSNTRLGILSIVGGSLVSMIGFVVLLYSVFLFSLSINRFGGDENGRIYSSSRNFFWESLYFGGGSSESNLPLPPAGDGIFLGKVEYLGEGVGNVILSIELNGKYKVEELKTDKAGEFIIKLPIGEWFINNLTIYQWQDAPGDEKFTLLSGLEPKLDNSHYHGRIYREDGYPVIVSKEKPEVPLVTAFIRPNVNILWPGKNSDYEVADLSSSVIEWEPYDNATEYVLKFNHVTKRSGGSTTFSSAAHHRVENGVSFPLANLSTKSSSAEVNEYTVQIFTFYDDKKLIGVSDRFTGGASFSLDNNTKIFEKSKRIIGSSSLSSKPIKGFFKNNRKLKERLDLQRD